MDGKTDLQPEMIVIAGPNGSGKTSVTRKFLHHEWAEGVLYINPDEVAKDMFGDWNSVEAVLKAANYCSDLREKCLKEKKSFVFETVMSAEDKLDFILRAKEQGFFVRLFYNSIDGEDARLLFRLVDGSLKKQYAEDVPEWARILLP